MLQPPYKLCEHGSLDELTTLKAWLWYVRTNKPTYKATAIKYLALVDLAIANRRSLGHTTTHEKLAAIMGSDVKICRPI